MLKSSSLGAIHELPLLETIISAVRNRCLDALNRRKTRRARIAARDAKSAYADFVSLATISIVGVCWQQFRLSIIAKIAVR